MVAPVRWATPGTDVLGARYPPCSARSTIQSASTPPPSPPMARIARVRARGAALSALSELKGAIELASTPNVLVPASAGNSRDAAVNSPLQKANHGNAQAGFRIIPPTWIGNNFAAIKGGAKPRGMRNFAA